MTIEKLLLVLGQTDKVVISDNHSSLTGKQMVDKVYLLAEQLSNMGINDKRVCLLRMANNIDSATILLAVLLNKAVVLVANPHDPISKVCQVIQRFKVFALLSDKATSLTVLKKIAVEQTNTRVAIFGSGIFANLFAANNDSIAEADGRLSKADIAIFSSGSTGEPKAIMHKIENLLLNAQLHAKSIDLQQQDKIGISLPLYYSYGLVANLFAGLITKTELCLQNQIGVVDHAWLQSKQISVLSLTPFLARRLTKQSTNLRIVTVGGDVFYSQQGIELVNQLPQCNIYSTYGLTEAGPRVATCKLTHETLKKDLILPLGKALDGVKLSLDIRNSSFGELLINTPTPMLGYYLGIEQGFINNKKHQIIESGDLYEHKDDELYFIGRKKKIIIQGGEKIFPQVIESAITEIDGVTEVLVGSIPCRQKGQVAKAYIVANQSLSIKVIKKTLMRQFSHSLIPEQLEFVDSIPRTLTGKVLGNTVISN